MSLTTPYKNPLKRNGTAQFERLIEALSPDGFKLDNRSLKDIMVASYRYASMLQYPDESGAITGDWTCFWEAETLTFLAVLCTIDTEDIAEGFAEVEKAGADESGKRGENYLEAIVYIHGLALMIENYFQKLPEDIPLRKEIEAIIRKNRITDAEQLEGALAKLIGWHKDAVNPDYLDQELYRAFMGSPNWGIANEVAFADIDFDDIYTTDDWQSLKQLAYQFLQALERIKSRACHWFDEYLGTPQLQQPHIALFLAFLRLFQHTRDEMNGLTKRHLDFYYEKVLHLCRKPAQPDDVYLIFQLANTVDQHLVEQGTELLAGKKDGKPLIFETIEDWVFSGATVEEIKNAYLHTVVDLDTESDLSQVYASADVTAAYENGEVLENVPVDCFRAFGDDSDLPEAAIGFAISSPQLILREGKRIVDIVLEGVDLGNIGDSLVIQLSSVEEVITITHNPEIDSDIPLEEIGIEENDNDPNLIPQGFAVRTNTIRVILGNDELPVDIPEKPLEGGIKTAFPYLKITGSSLVSQLQSNTEFIGVQINVKVFDVQETLIIESDEGVFDGTQKFLPFGNTPRIDNRFYIGSTEIFQKALHCIDVNFDWVNPVDFSDHYAPYDNVGFDIPDPYVEVEKINQGKWEKLTVPPEDIDQVTIVEGQETGNTISGNVRGFNGDSLIGATILIQGTSTGTVTDIDGNFSLSLNEGLPITLIFSYIGYDVLQVDIPPLTASISVILLEDIGNTSFLTGQNLKETHSFPDINHSRSPVLQKVDRLSTDLKRGFLKFQLKNDDFLHDDYQKVLVAYSAALSRDAVIGEDTDGNPIVSSGANLDFPKPPYTPTSNGIRVNYCSNQVMEFAGEYDHFYYILPCGYKKVEPVVIIDANGNSDIEPLPLLYDYAKNDQINENENEEENIQANGNLYLGIKDLQPGSNLSLLFRFKAGTEQDFDNLPPDEADFYWSYLAKNNQWLPFEVDAILKNTTGGYTRTGIVQLKTPYSMSKENTLFEGDYHWIRLAAVEDLTVEPAKTVRALPCLVSVTAQAIEARSVVDADDPTHFVNPKPLAAETIRRLAKSDSKVKKIEQPFPSFNGQMPEEDNDFYQRVSERLNHRNRAVTVLDYERLVLDRFPTVYRAKCLNHTQLKCEIAPGYVTLAAIPDIKQREVDPDFSPRFSLGDLREMAAFLRTKTNFFVAGNDGEDEYLKVVNPIYEEVKIRAAIKFSEGVDRVFFSKELDKELRYFIAPWALDENADISFDRTISRSAIIQFIERQEYVDAIKELEIYLNEIILEENKSVIVPTHSYSVLTTAAEHKVVAWPETLSSL